MRKRILIGVVAVALLAPVVFAAGCATATPTAPQTPTQPQATVQPVYQSNQQTGIWVNGTGEVLATPDVAVVDIGVQTQAMTVAEAQGQASQAMQDVMAALDEEGIAKADIQTTGYSIYQMTRWDATNQVEVATGYQVSNTVEVRIRDVGTAGAVIDAVVKAGGDAIRVNNIQFEINDPTPYLQQAREKAVADAQTRAQQLADLAGVTLGAVTYINESSQVPSVTPIRMAVGAGAETPVPAPINPGQTTITANVQMVYAIG